jgi:hypothetical protein
MELFSASFYPAVQRVLDNHQLLVLGSVPVPRSGRTIPQVRLHTTLHLQLERCIVHACTAVLACAQSLCAHVRLMFGQLSPCSMCAPTFMLHDTINVSETFCMCHNSLHRVPMPACHGCMMTTAQQVAAASSHNQCPDIVSGNHLTSSWLCCCRFRR